MHLKTIVAKRNDDGRWSWIKNNKLSALKKSYQRTPEKFIEENNNLYLIEVDKDRLNRAYSAVLKICGSTYALVLIMTNGETGKEFNTHHAYISRKTFKSKGEEYIKSFEKIIKTFALYVGETTDDTIEWFDGDYPIKLERIKSLYRQDHTLFYNLEGRLYYLRRISSVVEEMYFKALEIAGTDYALALALSTDDRTKQQHIMNFKRLGFKQAKTFSKYAQLFSDYIAKHQPLFEVELDD